MFSSIGKYAKFQGSRDSKGVYRICDSFPHPCSEISSDRVKLDIRVSYNFYVNFFLYMKKISIFSDYYLTKYPVSGQYRYSASGFSNIQSISHPELPLPYTAVHCVIEKEKYAEIQRCCS